jgi:5'-3' exonuclease
MGVPGFFAWITRTLKKNNIFIKSKDIREVDILFLDANCLFHPQCFKVLDLWNEENNNVENKQDIEKLEQLMIKRILSYIDYLVNYVNPKKGVYISVDGVAPLAKINQQRKRRYKTIYDEEIYNSIKIKHNKKINKTIWKNTVITPGTEFMELLHKNILDHIKNKKNYIYSSYHEPGEGEHKILQYIKKNKTIENNNDKYVIYGLDADLIFLAITSQHTNIYLLRESQELNIKVEKSDKYKLEEDLTYVSILETKKCINNIFKMYISSYSNVTNLDVDFTYDFVLLCFFLGNDFLPAIPSLNIKKRGIENILDTYAKLYVTYDKNIINYNKNQLNIDNIFFKSLIREFGNTEEYYFTNTVPRFNTINMRRKCNSNDKYDKAIWELERLTKLKNTDNVKIGIGAPDDWKFRYYEYYTNSIHNQDEIISEMCETYLEGIVWNCKYYFESCCAWDWQYTFYNSPFISDLSKYLNIQNDAINIINNINFDNYSNSNYLTPCQQLLTVLPPCQNKLLPNSYRNLILNDNSEISDFFPKKCKLDIVNKDMYWKCELLLPIVEINRIIDITKNLKLFKNEKIRNMCFAN